MESRDLAGVNFIIVEGKTYRVVMKSVPFCRLSPDVVNKEGSGRQVRALCRHLLIRTADVVVPVDIRNEQVKNTTA
jgi:hypothetical protein